jgi:hypothetical protein
VKKKVESGLGFGAEVEDPMGVWQGGAMDPLMLHPGPPWPTPLRPASGTPMKRPYGRYGVARPQGGKPVAVSYPFGYPTPYGYGGSPSPPLYQVVKLGALGRFKGQSYRLGLSASEIRLVKKQAWKRSLGTHGWIF